MGDRSNIAIRYSDGKEIFFYGHWMGEENVKIVERAVKRGLESGRIDDEAYFARIVFCEMLGDDLRDWRGETGFGISPYMVDQDYNNRIVWIDYTNTYKGVPEVRVMDY